MAIKDFFRTAKTTALSGLAAILIGASAGGCIMPKPDDEFLGETSRNYKQKLSNPSILLEDTQIVQDGAQGIVLIKGKVELKYLQMEWFEWKEKWNKYFAYYPDLPFNVKYRGEEVTIDKSTWLTAKWAEKREVPKEIKVRVEGESNLEKNVEVKEDGSFITTFKNELFRDNQKPLGEYEKRIQIKRRVMVESPIGGTPNQPGTESVSTEFPDRITSYDTGKDQDKLDRLAKGINNEIFELKIQIKDKDNYDAIFARLDIRGKNVPDLKARYDAVSDTKYETQTKKEDGIKFTEFTKMPGSWGVIDLYISQGDSYSESEKAHTEFKAVNGGEYTIEVTHPEYFHEKFTIKADKKNSKKIILLKKIGKKVDVTIDSDKGGRIVDED